MVSTNQLYTTRMPRMPNVYTGKNTQEMNKRQNYNRLHKKPTEIQKRLPAVKNTKDQIAQTLTGRI